MKKLNRSSRTPLEHIHKHNNAVQRSGFCAACKRARKRIAEKTKNSRLLKVTFHIFRHWKATMEYHRTKDILHVMRMLGHRNINNTLVYTHLVDFKTDEFISKVAKTADEASKLVEAGFEYICTTPENLMLFRKRK